jgi:hypothetical protein
MRNDQPNASLLPYLEAGRAPFRVEITTIPRKSASLETASIPFLRVCDSDPTACTTAANIITDAGSVVRKIFLYQQKDQYRLLDDNVWPVNNSDIDKLWQEAMAFYTHRSTNEFIDNAPLLLRDQIHSNGKFVRFQSLFYCKFRNAYFHPPCPQCSHYLQLCQDNQLLAEFDLLAYSSSLKRYLYCPECRRDKAQTEFYSLKQDPFDPPNLKDQHQLISDFGKLILNGSEADAFPCAACQEKTRCYGPENLVSKRIVPYAFYPFYLLIFEAATLHAIDFLMLLSGGSVDELRQNLLKKREVGRLNFIDDFFSEGARHPTFLTSPENPKRFLEILYLKLSFLGELTKTVSGSSESASGIDFPLSLDSVWINLPQHAERLPGIWNFKIKYFDITAHNAVSSHLTKYPSTYGHYLLGNAWFYVLLANNQQPIEQVRAELEQPLITASASDKGISKFIPKNIYPVLAPANIFWNPPSKPVKAKWQTFWGKALDLGGILLSAGTTPNTPWCEDHFCLDLESLKREILDELLGRSPLRTVEETENNEIEIAAILLKLREKCLAELKTATDLKEFGKHAHPELPKIEDEVETLAPGPPKPTGGDEDETLILSPGSYTEPKISTEQARNDEPVQETVVQSAKDMSRFPSRAKPPLTDDDETDLTETVILSPSKEAMGLPKSSPGPVQSHMADEDETDLTETVILSPSKEAMGLPKSSPGPVQSHMADEDETDLTETVILSPSKEAMGLPKSSPGPVQSHMADEDETDLTETVILSPSKNAMGIPKADRGSMDDSKKRPRSVDQKINRPENDDLLKETVVLPPRKEKK